jgi:polyketide synthase PksN
VKDQFLIANDHPVLRDHVVQGRHLMPGLAYIDLVYQFLRGADHAFADWELRDLSIYEPLAVSEGKPVVLTLESSSNADGSLEVLIQSEEPDGKTRRHVVVQAHRVKSAAFAESIDLSRIKHSAAAIEVKQIYDHYRDLGLAHGEFMKVYGSVYVADDAVYAELELSRDAIDESAEMLFSPALLDGSAVCGSVGLAHAKALVSRRLSLPVYFQSFRACAPLQGSCIARLRTDLVRRRKEVSYLTVEFFDRQGRKIAELRDLAGTAGLDSERPLAAPQPASAAVVEAHKRSENAARVAADSVPLHIEELLRTWLAERSSPCIVDTTMSFAEMGLDSAALLGLLRELEGAIDTPLSPTLLFEYANIEELAAHLAQTHGERFKVELRGNEVAVPAGAEAGPASETERLLRSHIARVLGIAPQLLNREASFSELGFDSAQLLSLLQGIEAQIGIGLSPTLLFEYHTLRELADYMASHYGASLQLAAIESEWVATVPPTLSATPPQQSIVDPPPTPAADTQVNGASNEPNANPGDIAILGISGRFPGAASVEQLWEVLKTGKDCVTEIPPERWDYRKYRYYEDYCRWGSIEFCHWGGFIDAVDEFDASFFNIEPLHAQVMDPQQRLFLQTTWQLLESAGYTRQRLRDEHKGRVGVYVGAMHRDYGHVESDISQELGSYLGFHSSIANRVSHFLDLSGPSLSLDTMCSSSAVAIHTACRDLRSGDCELAIVGGVNLSLHHKKFIALSHANQVGTDAGSRSFSKADGYLPAEAVAAVLLKPLAKAIAGRDRILGVIKSTAVNHSAGANAYTVPNPKGQAQVIEECLARAGVDSRTVSYVEATSNGSSLGDPIELVALNRVFSEPQQSCPIGSVKSNIGHAEAASALTQLAKVVLQFEHRQLPPSIRTQALNPLTQWTGAFRLLNELQEWPQPILDIDGTQQRYPRRALLNSFGAGGTNASLLLEEFVEPERHASRAGESATGRAEIMVFSARSADRLPVMLRQAFEHALRNPQVALADMAYTLQLGREAMESRLALVVSSREELLSVLERSLGFDPANDSSVAPSLPLFFGDSRSTSAVKSLIAGRAGNAMIEVLLRENDANRLALLWTQGAAIPWRLLHEHNGARLVQLPTYPFRKERHWLPPREHATTTQYVAEPPVAPVVSTEKSTASTVDRFLIGMNAAPDRIAPRNDLERAIADIWRQALNVDALGVTDSFFELGGSSLLAGLVMARCSDAFNVEMDWEAVLGAHPTVEGFAIAIVSKLATGMDERELEAVLADA